MPHRDTPAPGAPCWVDLYTSDQARARDFYCELLGWTADEPNPEFGGYMNFVKDGAWIAGCMGNDGSSGQPDAWSVYLSSPNAQATVDAATKAGAQVIVPAMQVGDLGTMAVVIDPAGAAIGLWESGEHPGFRQYDEINTPAWFELFTRDHAAAVAFYQDVFGWDVSVVGDTDEFRYSTLGKDEAALAGIMDASGFLPEGAPAHWSVYFRVADADVALKEVARLGGATVAAAEDTPYGRMATAADPTGAPFKLIAAI
jgi:predicted enzyme related to lactoylglutathione lyase